MYESSFNLSKRPFGAAPQVADYYPSTACESARKTLMRCVERNSGPSLLIGGPGSGKTILCLKLQEHFQAEMPTAYVSSCGIRTRRELLQQILFAFDRPYTASDEGELRISLTNFVYASSDGNVNLMLDDADDLPSELMEEVRSLSNLTQDGGWSINLILAGKSKLEELVGRPGMESLEQRVASRNYLHAWNLQETTDYVRYQISRADGDADAIFSDAAFEQLYELSDGLPRLVNQICDHSMIMAALGDVNQLDAIHLEEAWADLQQLPAPSRASTSSIGEENASFDDQGAAKFDESDDSMIEFGSLDDADPCDADACAESTCGPFNQVGEDVDDFAVRLRESEEDDRENSNSGELTCDIDASSNVEFETDGHVPGHEIVVDNEPQFDASFAQNETTDENDEDFPEQQEAFEASDIRLAPSSQGDLIDRLDDIEREVQRVSTELRGEDDGGNQPAMPTSTQTNNPFLEIFDEEEIVFGTHNTMNNELVRRQPAVFTSGGDALIQVIRMVDQGPSPNDWELHDDITGSQPAGNQLSLELASLPGLAVRHALEIADTNVCGNQFANDEFSFDYTVDTESESAADLVIGAGVDDSLDVHDFDGDDTEDLHSLDRPGEIDAERESMLLRGLGSASTECRPCEDASVNEASEFVSEPTSESMSEFEVDYLRRYAQDDSHPRDAVISGSDVGFDRPDCDESVSYESSDDLVFSSPSSETVQSAETEEDFDSVEHRQGDDPHNSSSHWAEFAVMPNAAATSISASNDESERAQAGPESPSSFSPATTPIEAPNVPFTDRFRDRKDQLEPIEQAMILPENYRGQFSNNTKFGQPTEQANNLPEPIEDKSNPVTKVEGFRNDQDEVLPPRNDNPKRAKRPFKNLFSKLKANTSE